MVLKYDGLLNMSLGRSRKETSWKNKEILWSALIERVQTTHRTAETYLEYVTAKKERQQEIKDVGGYVGGHLRGGNRGNTSIINRHLLTLDLDFADNDFWLDFSIRYGEAALIYSTHKHADSSPRYRLIMPLNRVVRPDEYEAIARRVAGNLNIEIFDPTTFQPARMMFWPSTSKDGIYEFEYQDGPFLDADAVLSTYPDWQDSSYWPVSIKDFDLVRTGIKKQGNPKEKPGIVGLFCRAYSMEEAIENFLTEDYERCDNGDRYTYLHGSTSAGLVVYDNMFAFSHHGTDPSSGRLCNAFDLVRIHLFGLQDSECAATTPVNKLPSYRAMAEMAGQDVRTRKLGGLERLKAAQADFDFEVDTNTKESAKEELNENQNDWLGLLDVDKNGNYKPTMVNITTILEKDPKLKGCFGYNEFTHNRQLLSDLPWRSIKDNNEITDSDESALRVYLERFYGVPATVNVTHALNAIIPKNTTHPVREYLDKVYWDGIERLDTLFIDYLGAEDTAYTRAVTRKTLVAAVARIYKPGTKFDHVLTFSGVEGVGKSTIIHRLGQGYSSDSFNTFHGKEAYEQIQGVWLVEMGELSATRRSDIETVKHFISKTEDRFRPAYARNSILSKRQCVFLATTNNPEPLRGTDGNRKFWVVDVNVQRRTKSVFTITDKEIAQIWAEAVVAYEENEDLYLSEELEAEARQIQREHTETDDREALVKQYLETPVPLDWKDKSHWERVEYIREAIIKPPKKSSGYYVRDTISVLEIMQELFGMAGKDLLPHACRPFHDIMKMQPDWQRISKKKRVLGGGGVICYGLIKNAEYAT